MTLVLQIALGVFIGFLAVVGCARFAGRRRVQPRENGQRPGRNPIPWTKVALLLPAFLFAPLLAVAFVVGNDLTHNSDQ